MISGSPFGTLSCRMNYLLTAAGLIMKVFETQYEYSLKVSLQNRSKFSSSLLKLWKLKQHLLIPLIRPVVGIQTFFILKLTLLGYVIPEIFLKFSGLRLYHFNKNILTVIYWISANLKWLFFKEEALFHYKNSIGHSTLTQLANRVICSALKYLRKAKSYR